VFFALDSTIEVNRDASKICRNLLNSRAEPDATQYSEDEHLVSCWERSEKGAATIYIDPNAMVSNSEEGYLGIHHGLIRAFGYVIAEMFLKLDMTKEAGDENKWHVKELASPKADDQKMLETLADAFISDVEASDGRYSLEDYQDLINGSDKQKEEFRFFVFAEAFDSYHCNNETRALIKKDFPETYKAMTSVVSVLNEPVESNTDGSELRLTSATSSRSCGCFMGFGSIFTGIFHGIKNVVLGTVHIIKRVIVGTFKLILIPFKAVFGSIVCIFEPLKPEVYVGTRPVGGIVGYKTPLQHPCQQSVSQKACTGTTDKDNKVTVEPAKKNPVTETTVSSETKTDESNKPAAQPPKHEVAKTKHKKWYQCGTLGNDLSGASPLAIMILLTLPLVVLPWRKWVV
jgi:hypothetical protein